MRRAIKRLAMIAAGAAALVATPASAGMVITYHAPNGWVAGYEVYDDCGTLIAQGGTTTPYVTTSYQPIACG